MKESSYKMWLHDTIMMSAIGKQKDLTWLKVETDLCSVKKNVI